MSMRVIVIAFLFSASLALAEQDDSGDLFSMDLEQLLTIRISTTASITAISGAELPAAITVITNEQIKATPARNIYDLIEIYVPGAFWMDFENGPLLGMRGSMANRNYRYLLLVNNRKINSKSFLGAASELEQWNLQDIERIEVVRGPGSVTYGVGAVTGVINIITHNASTSPGTGASFQYVSGYDSLGGQVSYGHSADAFDLYLSASATRTQGDNAPHFFGNNNGDVGFVGQVIDPGGEPLDYFADFDDKPQLKFYLETSFRNHWSFWARFTRQGSTWKGNETKTLIDGQFLNRQGVEIRQWISALEYHTRLSDTLALQATLVVDSFDGGRRRDKVVSLDPESSRNYKNNFGETEALLRTQLNWNASDKTEIGFGVELSRDFFGPGWGENSREMRLGDDGIIVSGLDSMAFPDLDLDRAVFAGDGWYTSTYSAFGEANIETDNGLKFLLSARADKNTFTDWLLSPRLAVIGTFREKHVLKLMLQKSRRMNSASQLFADNANNLDTGSESLDSIEISYVGKVRDKTHVSVTAYYNDGEVIGWSNDNDQTVTVGEIELLGLEAEVAYQSDNLDLGFNLSWTNQLDWNLAENINASSISYSDYNQPLRSTAAVMRGFGNDLNNWPNRSVKLFFNWRISENLSLHVDARHFSDYQGANDGLESLRLAVQGHPEQATVEQALAVVAAQNAYSSDGRLNASLRYQLQNGVEIGIFAINAIGSGNNKRYSFDTGLDRPAPKRVRFTEEPQVFGIRINYTASDNNRRRGH